MPELIFAACTPNSYPHDDGRVEHGYSLTVLDAGMDVLATVNLPDWNDFRREEAERHLADVGFLLQGSPDAPDAEDWTPAGLGYRACVVRAEH